MVSNKTTYLNARFEDMSCFFRLNIKVNSETLSRCKAKQKAISQIINGSTKDEVVFS